MVPWRPMSMDSLMSPRIRKRSVVEEVMVAATIAVDVVAGDSHVRYCTANDY